MQTFKEILFDFFAIRGPEDSEGMRLVDLILDKAKPKSYSPGDAITIEGEVASDFQFIVKGQVRVVQQSNFGKNFLCLLTPGDIIGITPHKLLDKAIEPYRRTADTHCVTEVETYSVLLSDLNALLFSQPSFRARMVKKEKEICIRQFIRTISKGKLDSPQLQKKIQLQIESIEVKSGRTVFYQGDPSDCIYYILQGTVEVSKNTTSGERHTLCQLHEDNIFGEVGVTSNTVRNATISTITNCVLLRIPKESFNQFIAYNASAHEMVSSIRNSRICPKLNENIVRHHRQHHDGSQTIVLEHLDTHCFLEIPAECSPLLDYLDGEHCAKDIILKINKKNHQISPNLLFETQYRLVAHQFAHCPKMIIKAPSTKQSPLSFKKRCVQLLTYEHEFSQLDKTLNFINRRYGHILFSRITQTLVFIIILLGFFYLGGHFQSFLPYSPSELIIGIAISLLLGGISIIGHEFAHGLLTHYFGGHCYRGGIGWNWITAIAFIDTTSMWNKPLKQRLLVNAAGIWFNLFFASLLLLPDYWGWYSLFWAKTFSLFSLLSYLGVFANLSTLLEYDGYYILSDLLDSPHLRKKSIQWARCFFSTLFKQKCNPFKKHYREAVYWFFTIIHTTTLIIITQNIIIAVILPGMSITPASATITMSIKAIVTLAIILLAAKFSRA